jgi:hypothetical protein
MEPSFEVCVQFIEVYIYIYIMVVVVAWTKSKLRTADQMRVVSYIAINRNMS